MDKKEIKNRLDIIKLATDIQDYDTINIQVRYLEHSKDKKLFEIASLLRRRSFKQALYLIKKYKEDNDLYESYFEFDGDGEYVLNVEDMLKMSPVANDTIREFRSNNGYTKDDLEKFRKNIKPRAIAQEESINSINKNYEEEGLIEDKHPNKISIAEPKVVDKIVKENKREPKVHSIEIKTEEELQKEIKSIDTNINIKEANSNTPLDEIETEEVEEKGKGKAKRAKVISTYKTLRAKFARKEGDKDKKGDEVKPNPYKVEEKEAEELSNEEQKSSLILDKIRHIKSRIGSKKSQGNIEADSSNASKELIYRDESTIQDEIYHPIPDIEHKYRQAFTFFTPAQKSEFWDDDIKGFLDKISKEAYTEDDIRDIFEKYEESLEKSRLDKASQYLLLAAMTESKYAKFILARELFRGKVLNRDIQKSFELMNQLANNEGYADAICDLGQFYEYGIGVNQDKKIALKLYEKAFELGVNRATKHINRIRESSNFLSSIKRLFG